MGHKVEEILADLKSYLQYLRDMGIEALPASEGRSDMTFNHSSPLRSKALALDDIRRELGDCKRCKLHRTRRTIVFGEGNERAKLMLIGEGPGFDEDLQGRPFVGKAGQLLTRILHSIHLQREEVYITNTIK